MGAKKKTKGSLIGSGVLCFIVAVGCLIGAFALVALNSDYMVKGNTTNLNEVVTNGEEYPIGSYVTLTVDCCLGNYATTTHKVNFIPVGKDQHFVVWLDDSSFISVKAKSKKDVKALNEIVDKTNASDDLISDTTYTIQGKLENFDNSKIKEFYTTSLNDINASDYGFIKYYQVDATESRASLWGYFVLLLVVGAGFVLGGLSSFKQAKNFDLAKAAAFDNVNSGAVNYTPVDTSTPYDANGGPQYDPNSNNGSFNQ